MADKVAREFNWTGELRKDRPQKKKFHNTEVQQGLFSKYQMYYSHCK